MPTCELCNKGTHLRTREPPPRARHALSGMRGCTSAASPAQSCSQCYQDGEQLHELGIDGCGEEVTPQNVQEESPVVNTRAARRAGSKALSGKSRLVTGGMLDRRGDAAVEGSGPLLSAGELTS
jgi:hypothetical protein